MYGDLLSNNQILAALIDSLMNDLAIFFLIIIGIFYLSKKYFCIQVKDKSLGLLNMLDIVKLQGQMRIKNDNDKRIMRQFNVEKSSILGFNIPATFKKKQPTN